MTSASKGSLAAAGPPAHQANYMTLLRAWASECWTVQRSPLSSDPVHMILFFPPTKMHFSWQSISTHFFSMKMAELGKNALVSYIIDFDDIQLCLRHFCLNLNICKIMTTFFKFWPKKIRKSGITLQRLRFKQNCPSQSWISSKSIMQLTKSIFENSAIEKKWVENQLWGKSGFSWG